MPTLSLCMIVRDEASMLPACLDSVRGVADDVVVVDTGSVDETVDVATARGAKVLASPWREDFSVPRNVGLDAAKGEWILVLDADERLTVHGARALRQAIERGDFDCGMLPLHNASRLDAPFDEVVSGRARLGDVAFLPRLFRRTPDLRYTGIVHENVGEWLFSRGRRAKLLTGVDIVHLGGVPDVRAKRSKSERNIRLLERACLANPEDPGNWGYLAFEHFEAGDRVKARVAADSGFSALVAGHAASELSAIRLTVARAWLQVQTGEGDAARETLHFAAKTAGEHPDLHFVHGCISEVKALSAGSRDERVRLLEEALVYQDSALACASGTYLQKFIDGCCGWAAQVRRGTVLSLLGRFDQALAAFDSALSQNRSAREAGIGRAEVLLANGDVRASLREIKPWLDDKPDGWTVAALAAGLAGNVESMASWTARAQASLPSGFLSPPRRERYADAVATLALYLEREVEAPGPLGVLADIVRGRQRGDRSPPVRGLDDPLVASLVGRLVGRWLEGGKTEVVERLLGSNAEAALPGLGSIVSRVLDELEAQGQGR